jgi:hypothetical protein
MLWVDTWLPTGQNNSKLAGKNLVAVRPLLSKMFHENHVSSDEKLSFLSNLLKLKFTADIVYVYCIIISVKT